MASLSTTICDGAIEVVRATIEDVDCILGILSQAGRWLLAKGIRQWPTPPPRKWLLTCVERGEFYLAREHETAVGTFRLSGSDEDGLWGKTPADAGYLGKLAICRSVAGRGIGLELLRAAERIAASAGKVVLRLDCWSGNAILCDYYTRAGFRKRGTGSYADYSVCLYEKKLG